VPWHPRCSYFLEHPHRRQQHLMRRSVKGLWNSDSGKQAMENNGNPIGDHSNGVVVVRPKAEIMLRQQLPYYRDLRSYGRRKKSISMNLIIIPPGGAAEPICTRDMKPLFTCSRAGWILVTARSWRIRLSVKREISFISKPTCRTNPSILAPPNRQWLRRTQ
jgi:hypothetical protein